MSFITAFKQVQDKERERERHGEKEREKNSLALILLLEPQEWQESETIKFACCIFKKKDKKKRINSPLVGRKDPYKDR